MHILTALYLLSLITGCAAPNFVKDGMTPEQLEADKFDCEQKVITMYGGYHNMGPGDALFAGPDLRRCLMVKGYRIAPTMEKTTIMDGRH